MQYAKEKYKNLLISRNPEQLFSEIDNEVVMLNIQSGEYYSLNSIGSAIWKMLSIPSTFEALIKSLMEDYNVDRVTCENDTNEFIEESVSLGIIRISNDGTK